MKYRIVDRYGNQTYSQVFKWISIVSFIIAFLSIGYWDWLYFVYDPAVILTPRFVLATVLLIVALVVAWRASVVISINSAADMRSERLPDLATGGIYSRIRHPLYLATVMMFLTLALIYPDLRVVVFALGMAVYTVFGAYLEERKLITYYGDEYLRYRQTAGFLLPRLRRPRVLDSATGSASSAESLRDAGTS